MPRRGHEHGLGPGADTRTRAGGADRAPGGQAQHVPEVLSARFERPSPRHLITEHAMALGAMLNTAQSLQSVEMLA